ncbi:PTS glucitol/sorbitol transporter subunit IIA [Nissabacter sp. SGAir0207]|uniref:PTS glucitol/sorbitol transporter subunit IIA n=1 Tax=Nissabacter sp. SGAir0207 TaxID=2126321 RepID=UPI0010CD17E2|nr:PTS glucitol/sorbitol transporter subunit IIA [Nissabacter sp. SGAir0207]QCR37959.1 PTS glucitol/sorbitol transporter subunit IIA [Nissabacter sp. SGAir0207]
MQTLYESTFTAVGACARESLEENFLITFGEGAPQEVAEYCFIHRPAINQGGPVAAGAVVAIGEQRYPVTAVGEVATQNLRELGHITLRFDGAAVAEFPGCVHVAGTLPRTIAPGQTFRVLSD